MSDVTQIRSALHETARLYAADGIPVFPCRVGGKEPTCPHGFHDATTDMRQIDAWWGATEYNIGIVPESAGWCVVDVDNMESWRAACGAVSVTEAPAGSEETGFNSPPPPTYTIATPSGGKHLYYAGSLPSSASKLAPGVDTRGRGSYVLVPPSVVAGGQYIVIDDRDPAPLPAWIADRINASAAPPATAAPEIELDLPDNIERARVRLRELASEGDVAREGQGGDDRTYRLAAELHGLGLSPEVATDLLLEEWNPYCDPPWEEDELIEKVANAWRYAQNEAGAYAIGPPPETWQQGAYDNPPDPPPVYPVFASLAQVRYKVYPPLEWVWQGRFLAGQPNLLTGDSKSGKTTLAKNLAVCVAAGIPCLGADTKQMRVVMLLGEDLAGPVRDDLLQIIQQLGAPDDTMACINFLSVLSERVPSGHKLASVDDAGEIEHSRFLSECVVPVLLQSPCLFIIDPIKEFVRFDQNKDTPAREVVTGFLGGLCSLPGVTVLNNDHPSKASMAQGQHSSGSIQFKASHASFATLLKKPNSGKQMVRVLDFKELRYGPSHEITIYRGPDSATLTLEGAVGQRPQDHARAVYRHIVERLDAGLRTGRDNRSEYGPGGVAHALDMAQGDVERSLAYCRGQGWLAYQNATGHTPAGWERGHVTPLLVSAEDY